jgi:hypothetical protein
MTDTDPAYAPIPELACVIPGCTNVATTHLTIISTPEEHELPLCATHHLEYSQPGHLKRLKELAGLGLSGVVQIHQAGEHIPQADEPGPEVVKAAK